jgi:putative endonuclease
MSIIQGGSSDGRSKGGTRPEVPGGTGDAGAPGDPRRALGNRAEEICARKLIQRGWRILDRNWRVRLGEIDIVAMDGDSLVILEVKAHSSLNRSGTTAPVMAVGPQKQRRLRRLASAWLTMARQGRGFENLRFDVVGITFAPDGEVAGYEHLENAF